MISKIDVNSYKIRTKLLWMLLPLLLSMFLLGTYTVSEKYGHYKMSHISSETILISMNITNLVHTLQIERGLSASYMESFDPKYKELLKGERQSSDYIFQVLVQIIKTDILDEKSIKKEILGIKKGFEKIKSIRKEIDSMNKIDAFEAYSKIITKYLQTIHNLSYSVSNSTLARDYDSYLLLLWLQEYAAKERGMLSSVFEAKELGARKHMLISEYTYKFEQLLESFYGTAATKYKTQLEKQLKLPVINDVNTLIKSTNTVYKNYFINELLPFLGFRGMVHNFKNYLIRGDESYLKMFKQDYINALNIIEKYYDLEHFSEVDKEQLLIIKNTILNYRDMLPIIIKMKKDSKEIDEIDRIVQVNILPAVNAIKYLRENISDISVSEWWEQSTKRIELIKQVSDDMQADILIYSEKEKENMAKTLSVFILVLFLVVFIPPILAILIMHRSVRDLISTTEVIHKMRESGDYSNTLKITGSDELSDMQEAFNKLIRDKNEAELNQRLSSEVFNNIAEGIVVLNSNMEIEVVNPAFSKITGYSFEDVKGTHISEQHESEDSKILYKKIEEALLKNNTFEGEVVCKRKNGETYIEFLTISILRDKDNNISKYLRVFRDITVKKADEEKILYQANHDALTGLLNRNKGMRVLEHELKVAKRNKKLLALMFIDLDGFKAVNDTFGHECGDVVLKETSARFLKSVREIDIVARIGGDEFMVILPGINTLEDVGRVAQTIIDEMSHPFGSKDEICGLVSVSIGVSFYPNDAQDAASLLKHADKAMYKVKEHGKNSYMLYSNMV